MHVSRTCGLIAAVAIALASTGLARAATVNWEGQTWDDDYNSPETSLNVNGLNQLEVSAATAGQWAAAHYDTDVAYRAASTPFVEVGFLDTGSAGVRKGLWIEDESGTPGSAGGWVQFEIPASGSNYRIFYNDYDADILDGGGIDFSAGQVIDTGVARSVGEHALKVGRRGDGTVDFWVDGGLVASLTAAQFNPNYFGDFYLAARDETATYTSFTTGTNYVVPEPSSVMLALAAAVGLLLVRRRRAA